MWATFDQNNSGGGFIGPGKHVCVEGTDNEDILKRAEAIGLYFDGCASHKDCSCCGDRWSRPYELSDEPLVYGQTLEDYRTDLDRPGSFPELWDESRGPLLLVVPIIEEKEGR